MPFGEGQVAEPGWECWALVLPLKAVWSGGKSPGPNGRQPQRILRVSQGNAGRAREVAGSQSQVTRMGWARLVSWSPAQCLSACLRESWKVGATSTHSSVVMYSFTAFSGSRGLGTGGLCATHLEGFEDRQGGWRTEWGEGWRRGGEKCPESMSRAGGSRTTDFCVRRPELISQFPWKLTAPENQAQAYLEQVSGFPLVGRREMSPPTKRGN